jgi:hypothetical protein
VEVGKLSRLAAQLEGVPESCRDGLLHRRYHGRLVARQLDDTHIVIRASFVFRDLLLYWFPETSRRQQALHSSVTMSERALLLLADVAGYTEFMRLHRLNLAHSQEITRRLLESMLDAVPELRLVEVEGDALFLSAPHDDGGEPVGSSGWLPSALAMHRAFHAQQQWMVAHNLCACDACRQIGSLQVKFVAHLGDVVPQRIRDTEKLVGVDVIAVHRMLKNDVPAGEYVLMSERLYEHLDAPFRDRAVGVDQELDGFGSMRLYFVELGELPLEPSALPEPGLPARVRETVGLGLRAFPRMVGLASARRRVTRRGP